MLSVSFPTGCIHDLVDTKPAFKAVASLIPRLLNQAIAAPDRGILFTFFATDIGSTFLVSGNFSRIGTIPS